VLNKTHAHDVIKAAIEIWDFTGVRAAEWTKQGLPAFFTTWPVCTLGIPCWYCTAAKSPQIPIFYVSPLLFHLNPCNNIFRNLVSPSDGGRAV
jgi:hypothetical protein